MPMEYSSIVEPVKLIAAVLYREPTSYIKAKELMEDTFSKIDYEGTFFDFTDSDYYEKEMGSGLKKGIISFEKLINPEELVEVKHMAHHLENELSIQDDRIVNIDAGYLDIFKLVLASFKGRSNKIYMGRRIWADIISYFEKGHYQSFIWTFPDFKRGLYEPDLIQIRDNYKKQIRSMR